MIETVPARPGRPRTEGHDARILQATVDLLDHGEEVTVDRVVAGSGVSRAAIYRRWPSMTDLIAAALDHGREPMAITTDGDLLAQVLSLYTSGSASAGASYSDARFRMRIRLAMSDRRIATAYWTSHVARRRRAMVAVLEEGMRRGELLADLDVDACIDLLNGVMYYQLVVRGVRLDDAAARARCAVAIRVAWRGMTASASS